VTFAVYKSTYLLTYLLTYDLDLPLAMISSSSLLDAMLTNTFLDGCCLLSNVYPKVDVMHAFMLLICAVMLSFLHPVLVFKVLRLSLKPG